MIIQPPVFSIIPIKMGFTPRGVGNLVSIGSDKETCSATNLWICYQCGLIYILTVIILFLAAEAGFRSGKHIQKRWPDKSEAGVGVMVGAALALLGFLLAFVTSIAIGNFNHRRQLVVSEANAIGTTYLRAGYLADPYAVESCKLLREYVNLRVKALDPAATATAIARSEQIHDELWLLAEEVASDNSGPTIALYLSAVKSSY